jgi:integrase
MSDSMRGGVIKRGAGWSYVVRERDPETGRTKPRWVSGFATQKEAKAARAEAMTAMNRGTYVAPRDMTVGEWLDQWIAGHVVELKPSTADSYRANIARYLKPAIGHERLQGLSTGRLSVVFREMYEGGGKGGKPLSPRTVEFARAVLRRALQDALHEHVISVNPVVGTKRPRVTKPKHQTWTAAQLHTYLEHTAGQQHGTMYALAAATGMRRGELCGLRWADVELDTGVVRVEQSVTQVGSVRRYSTPKNHERRTVNIDAATVAALRALRVDQAKARLAWGSAWQGHEGLVFGWENGAPVLPDYVTKHFVRTQADLDLPRLKLHELRHSHATLLLRAGVPVHIVAKRLGHKDPSVTLNVYADAIPDDDGHAVDVFTKAVYGA